MKVESGELGDANLDYLTTFFYKEGVSIFGRCNLLHFEATDFPYAPSISNMYRAVMWGIVHILL